MTRKDLQSDKVTTSSGTSSSKNVTFFLKRAHVCSWTSISGKEHYILAQLHASYFWRTINVFISGKCTSSYRESFLTFSPVQLYFRVIWHGTLHALFIQYSCTKLSIQVNPIIIKCWNIIRWDYTLCKYCKYILNVNSHVGI